MAIAVEVNYLNSSGEYDTLSFGGNTTIINGSGSVIALNVVSAFQGKSYKITGGGLNLSGIVPDGGIISFSCQQVNTDIIITINNLSMTFQIPQWYGYITKRFPSEDFNENSWNLISYCSQNNLAKDLWKAGDTKKITISGTLDGTSYNTSNYSLVILGINHNAAVEGNNRIHMVLGKTNDKLATFCNLKMNPTNSNVGGWTGSDMYKIYCPAFINMLSSDLKSVLQTVIKWTDNVGNNQNNSSSVTANTSNCNLMAEFEVFGVRAYANQYEQNKQTQYDLFKNVFTTSASRIFYQ